MKTADARKEMRVNFLRRLLGRDEKAEVVYANKLVVELEKYNRKVQQTLLLAVEVAAHRHHREERLLAMTRFLLDLKKG